MVTSKFCRDCRFLHGSFLIEKWQDRICSHPSLFIPDSVNPVTGTPYKRVETAHSARMEPTLCGPEGKWFKPTDSLAFVRSLGVPAADNTQKQPVPSRKNRLEDFM